MKARAWKETVFGGLLMALALSGSAALADDSAPGIATAESIVQPCGLNCPRGCPVYVCPEPCLIPAPGVPATPAPSPTAPSTTAPSTTAPSTTAPSTTTPSTTTPSTTTPSTTTPSTSEQSSTSTPSTGDLGSTTSGATGAAAAVPSIQGDSNFGGLASQFCGGQTGLAAGWPGDNGHRIIGPNETIIGAPVLGRPTDFLVAFTAAIGPNTSVFVGGFAIASPILGQDMINWAENGTVIPQNRVFYDYRHYDHVGEIAGYEKSSRNPAPDQYYGQWLNVDRHLVGFEKMIGDCTSFELRVPLHYQIDPRASFTEFHHNYDGGDDLQIGNLGFSVKTYLVDRENFKVTGSLGMQFPTQQDTLFTSHANAYFNSGLLPGNNQLAGHLVSSASILQKSETVWMCPTLGTLWTPTERFFNQGIFQLDIPLNPSDVTISYAGSVLFDRVDGVNIWTINGVNQALNPIPLNGQQSFEAVYATIMRIDEQFGYWLRDDPCKTINRIGALCEVEVNQLLGPNQCEKAATLVNLGPALDFQAGKTEFRTGLLVPVTPFQQYDWELAVTLNRRF